MDDYLNRLRRRLSVETLILAGLLWLCIVPLVTTLVLPHLGAFVAALLAVAALVAATVAAAALTSSLTTASGGTAADLSEARTGRTAAVRRRLRRRGTVAAARLHPQQP